MKPRKNRRNDAALLEALRSNLGLLSELTARYQVDTRPAHEDNPPTISRPGDVHRLLGPEMTPPGPGAVEGAAAGR